MPITRPNMNLYSINNLALDLPCAWEKIFRWPIRRSWA